MPELIYQFTNLKKNTLFQNAPCDAMREPLQNAPYERHQRVIFDPTQ